MPADAARPEAPLAGAPHRVSEPTALERWVERPPPLTPLPTSWDGLPPSLLTASTLVLLIAVPSLHRAATVVGLGLVLWLRYDLERRARRRHEQLFAALAAEVATLPFPVGDLRHWLGVRERVLAPLVIRLASSNALAAHAIRVAEPSARIEQPEPDMLIVTAEWRNTPADLPRVRRVLVELLPLLHAESRIRGVEFLDHPPRYSVRSPPPPLAPGRE